MIAALAAVMLTAVCCLGAPPPNTIGDPHANRCYYGVNHDRTRDT